MTYSPPQWLLSLSNKEFHQLLVVSVDLCGSSSPRNYLQNAFKIHAAIALIRNCIHRWAQESNGAALFWAGDGGAFLFHPVGTDEIQVRYSALRFAVGIRYMSWAPLLSWKRLEEFATAALDSGKIATASIGESIVREVREYVDRNCPMTGGVDWFGEASEEAKWSCDQNPDGQTTPPTSAPMFRIVCHKADDVCIDPSDLQTVFSEDLSFVLKYERELGIRNAITVTDSFRSTYVPRFPLSNAVECIRKNSEGKRAVLKVHPPALYPELQLLVNSGLSAAHFKTSEGDLVTQNLLVKKILAFFNNASPTALNRADIYNIGLGTLATNLPDLWLPLIERKVTMRLLLFDEYLDDKEETISTETILNDLFARIKTKYAQQWPEIRQKFEETVTLRQLRRGQVGATVKHGSSSDLGPGIGCSLYFTGESEHPEEGSNVFLTAPFSRWSPLSEQSGYWNYQRAFYFCDVHAEPYLRELASMFSKYWHAGDEMARPWQNV